LIELSICGKMPETRSSLVVPTYGVPPAAGGVSLAGRFGDELIEDLFGLSESHRGVLEPACSVLPNRPKVNFTWKPLPWDSIWTL